VRFIHIVGATETITATHASGWSSLVLSQLGQWVTFRWSVLGWTILEQGVLDWYGTSAPTTTCPAAPVPRSSGLPPVDPSRDDVLFGVDIDVASDLPRSFVLAAGLPNLGNAIVRRLSTPNGALAAFGDDPDYGYDLRGKLNASMPLGRIQGLGPELEAEVLKEERVDAADVALAFDLASGVLSVDIAMVTALGPFRLILAVSADRTIEIVGGTRMPPLYRAGPPVLDE
jgi:hypothetical protein